jgi:hypothetical protein
MLHPIRVVLVDAGEGIAQSRAFLSAGQITLVT